MKQAILKIRKLGGEWWIAVLVCVPILVKMVYLFFEDFHSFKLHLCDCIFILIGCLIDEFILSKAVCTRQDKNIRNCCRCLITLPLLLLDGICFGFLDSNEGIIPEFGIMCGCFIMCMWSLISLLSLAYCKKGALFTFRILMIFWLIVSYCFLHGKDGVIASLRASDLLNLFCSVSVVCLVASLLIRGLIISFKSEIIEMYSNAPAKWYTIFYNFFIIFTIIILCINPNV